MHYIHYGSDSFDINKFEPVSNRERWNKPNGGLWSSPIDSNNGWRDWCLSNFYTRCDLNKSVEFDLSNDTNIFKIYDNETLSKLLYYTKDPSLGIFSVDDRYHNINFEWLMIHGYDGIEVLINTEEIYFKLYGWDCDTLLIFNPDVMIFNKE